MIIDQIVIDDKMHNYTQTSGGSIVLLGTHSEEEAAMVKQKIRTQISTKKRRPIVTTEFFYGRVW